MRRTLNFSSKGDSHRPANYCDGRLGIESFNGLSQVGKQASSPGQPPYSLYPFLLDLAKKVALLPQSEELLMVHQPLFILKLCGNPVFIPALW